eukprot:1146079-Pelagomonas_calceolata.AAC.5
MAVSILGSSPFFSFLSSPAACSCLLRTGSRMKNMVPAASGMAHKIECDTQGGWPLLIKDYRQQGNQHGPCCNQKDTHGPINAAQGEVLEHVEDRQ